MQPALTCLGLCVSSPSFSFVCIDRSYSIYNCVYVYNTYLKRGIPISNSWTMTLMYSLSSGVWWDIPQVPAIRRVSFDGKIH